MTANHADSDSSHCIVDVRELEKVYAGGWFRRSVNVLRGVTLQASAGEVFGLLGPNGAGKTTLIKILLGVVKPTRGSASLFGEAVGSADVRSRVGYLPESLSIDSHHTARSALRYYGRLSRMSANDIARRSDELLELVGLRNRDRESVRRFSKGMRQRLGLAQALLHDPDLLVLDEPTDGLDPVGRSEVRRVIERLRDAGKTIFLNSHILQEVELVCTRAAIMAKGRIRALGRIDELSEGRTGRDQVVIETLASGDGDEDHEAHVASCLQSLAELNPAVSPSQDGCRVELVVSQQSQIDGVVDSLRAGGVSLGGLLVKRPTLEDTFIKLVGAADAEESQVS